MKKLVTVLAFSACAIMSSLSFGGDKLDFSVSTQVVLADCKIENNDQASYKLYSCLAISTDGKDENTIEGCASIGDYGLGMFLFLRTNATVVMSTAKDSYQIVFDTKTRHDGNFAEKRVFTAKLSDMKNKTFKAEMITKESVANETLKQKLTCTVPAEI